MPPVFRADPRPAVASADPSGPASSWGCLVRRTGLVALVCGPLGCEPLPPSGATDASGTAFAVPNDNRAASGVLQGGLLELDLEARPARWEGEESDLGPEAATPSVIEVLGFAAGAGPVMIPGPLVRVRQGTEVRIRVRNSIPEDYPIGLPMPGTTLKLVSVCVMMSR